MRKTEISDAQFVDYGIRMIQLGRSLTNSIKKSLKLILQVKITSFDLNRYNTRMRTNQAQP